MNKTGTLGWRRDFIKLRKRYPEIMGKYEIFIDSLRRLNNNLSGGKVCHAPADYENYRKLVAFLQEITLIDLKLYKH